MASNPLGSSTAVEKHVDQMETISTSFVVPVLVVLLAAASIAKDFEILGIHLETADAYGIVVAIFDCLLLLFCTTCWKAADLLKACGDEEKGRAIVAVVTHKWLLNPFSYSRRFPECNKLRGGCGSADLLLVGRALRPQAPRRRDPQSGRL
jgi:hypothetical protein